MAANAASDLTLQDWLTALEDLPASRVRLVPPPGRATAADLAAAHRGGGLCELVDGTLVDKAIGYEASVVALAIASILRNFVVPRSLGIVSGADGFFRLRSSTRGPDVRQEIPIGWLQHQLAAVVCSVQRVSATRA